MDSNNNNNNNNNSEYINKDVKLINERDNIQQQQQQQQPIQHSKITQEEQDLLNNILIMSETPIPMSPKINITNNIYLKDSTSFDLSTNNDFDPACIVVSPIAVSPTIINKLVNTSTGISNHNINNINNILNNINNHSNNNDHHDRELTSILLNNQIPTTITPIPSTINASATTTTTTTTASLLSQTTFRPVTPVRAADQQFSYEKISTPTLTSTRNVLLNKKSNSPIPFPSIGSLINDPTPISSSSSNSSSKLISTPPSTPTQSSTLPPLPSTPININNTDSSNNNINEDNNNESSTASSSSTTSTTSKSKLTNWSFKRYLSDEIHGGYLSNDANDTLKREQVYNFVHVPWELEQLILFGFLVCFDSFLFLFTFLPIRFFLSFFKLLTSPFSKKNRLTTNQIFDLFRGFIWVLCFIFLNFIDSSMLYHYIRGQAVIKLYVIYNVLEVLDKLCCSFGQDIFDSLYWMSSSIHKQDGTTTGGSSGGGSGGSVKYIKETRILGPFTHILVATGYVLLHSLVLFCQVITLNVAINSYNNALLTLMISNQFVELKGSVFKRFEKENLFQISCSDIVERFQAFIFLMIIIFQNLSDLNWDLSWDFAVNMATVVGTVWGSELLVDAIKHAFITKFNRFSPQMYSKFFFLLADTIVDARNRNFTESSWGINSIIGFVPFPLASIVIRVFHKFIPNGWFGLIISIQVYLCLVLLKILIKIIIIGQCLSKNNIIEMVNAANNSSSGGGGNTTNDKKTN